MKQILTLSITLFLAFGTFAQLREAAWYSFGMEYVSGNYKGVSPIFVDDSYKLNNIFTCTYQGIHKKNFMVVDISGLFYPMIGEIVKAKGSTSSEMYNLRSYTNQTQQKIGNRISFGISISKFLGANDGRFVSAFGWQANTRMFGLADFRTKKKTDQITDSPDAGPLSGRRTLNVGINYQLMNQFGENIFLRTGIFAEGIVGFTQGAMVYPEASLILNWKFISLIGSARYEATYLTTKPRISHVYYADKSTFHSALRLNFSVGFDIDFKRKKKR